MDLHVLYLTGAGVIAYFAVAALVFLVLYDRVLSYRSAVALLALCWAPIGVITLVIAAWRHLSRERQSIPPGVSQDAGLP